MKAQKNLIKLANYLLLALSELQKQDFCQIRKYFEDFKHKCSDAVKDSKMFNYALERNWQRSVEKIRARTARNLNDFSYHLQRFKELVSTDKAKLPKLSDIYAELLQLDKELGQFQYDLQEKTISVITEPIVLDDIPFGPFEIRLFIEQISRFYIESPYRVIALEPNPAGADSGVTHPHVSAERLCEGDGHVSIKRALEQGRFCDFFTMIVSILQTYNPDSPYVSLSEWEGISCYDCGYTVSGDSCYYCTFCDRDYCDQCSSYCRLCDETVCLGCGGQCPHCEEFVCPNCIGKCSECEEICCGECLDENVCPNCKEERESDEESEEQVHTETSASVQSDSVGQATVHA